MVRKTIKTKEKRKRTIFEDFLFLFVNSSNILFLKVLTTNKTIYIKKNNN